ncbi:MAG: sialate O-acetylesterase [Novosphingobium sp.]
MLGKRMLMRRGCGLALGPALGLLAGTGAAAQELEISAVWTDHAVIQRGTPVIVEGRAAPGQRIAARLGNEAANARADGTGRFALTFAPRPASAEPVALTLEAGGHRLERRDLLVGDVWLCSGQSNMEFALSRALNGEAEAARAADPALRLLQVPKGQAFTPQTGFAAPVQWMPSTPESAADFSAACWFMARELRRQRGVPVGAIHASWGGSKVNPWLDPQAGAALAGADDMALLRLYEKEPLAAVTRFAPRWQDWYRVQGKAAPWADPDALAWQPVPAITGWQAWQGTPLAANTIGTVWLRRQIVLDKAQAQAASGADARLHLGVLDDMDMTFVNGRAVGNTFGWDEERAYRLPPGTLREGVNEVLVAVTNTYGNGGFASAPDRLMLELGNGARMALADGWRFAIAPVAGDPPRPPWDANAGIGLMHNRMIAPLGRFAMEGAAWYQGESDVGTADYPARMAGLIAGWRARFGDGLKVLVVQLANYGPPADHPVPSGWAQMRDMQRRIAAADPAAALVSAIDLGERTDIHPANKLTLAERLAMAAQGQPMPMPLSARREADGRVRIGLAGIAGGLHAWSAQGPIGFELCDAAASCRFARAAIDGESVLLEGDGKPVAEVRYAWADNPVVNLYDGRMLPVPGFALPVSE